MNIFELIKNNINKILNEIDQDKKEYIYYLNDNEYLKFFFKGKGSFGDVYQVTNYTKHIQDIPKKNSIILKIIKNKCDEYERCIKLKNKMEKITKKVKKFLVEKYTTKILSLQKINNIELIFLEYVDGYDLKSLLFDKKLNEDELGLLYLKCLISIKVFHKLLNYSHRDIKLNNFIYDKKNDNVKLIDYGFICNRKDKKCYNKYQGTAHYIHPYMNKKYSNHKLSKKNNSYNTNNLNKSFTSNIKSKKIFKYPNSISQDLFSSVIIFIKLLYIYNYKNNINNDLQKLLKKFNDSSNRENRYINKKKLILKLQKINTKYNNSIIELIIGVLKNFWNIKKMDFSINNIENENISQYIFNSLIYSLIILTPNVKNKHFIINEWRNILKIK